MKIIILGAGRRGIRLARHLTDEQNDVILIDENPSRVNLAMNSADCIGFQGNGTDIQELENADIQNADAFIALTGEDETNLVSCGIAAGRFNIPITIAAVRNISYTGKTNERNLMGISHIVNPSAAVAQYIYREVKHGIFTDLITFENSSLVMYSVDVEHKSRFEGKLVKNIKKSIPGNYVIATILRNGKTFIPSGDTEICTNDRLSIVATDEVLSDILKTVGIKHAVPKRVAIVGGTEITDYLLKLLSPSEMKKVKVIAKDSMVCQTLSEKYPAAEIINRDIAAEGVFEQEDLEKADLLLALTDNDELNILTASYAKAYGIRGSIALVNKNPDYKRMAKHLDIDSIISTQDVTIDSISDCLAGDDVSNTRTAPGGEISTFEFNIGSSSPLIGKALKDIDIRGKGLIAGVTKEDSTIIPNGKYVFCENDRLMVVAVRKDSSYVRSLFREKQCI